MPRPRGGLGLDAEVRSLRDAKATALVSLLTDAEVAELELQEEANSCRRHGIRFLSLPIKDRQVPTLDLGVVTILTELADELKAGGNVVVHCRRGIGRAALMAVCILLLLGLEEQQAWAVVEEARRCPVPDKEEQRAWVRRFARSHQAVQDTDDLWR